MKDDGGEAELRRAFDELDSELSPRLARWSSKLRRPDFRRIRIALALGLIALSMLWFLPVIGIEFLPLGLLLLAVDVPILRRPLARMLLWVLHKWRRLKAWWARRRTSDGT